MVVVKDHQQREPSMGDITTIGLDLAKSVFQVHAIDEAGSVVMRKRLRRSQVLAFFAKVPPCLVGLEACGTAHHWARELIALGHEARLMPPNYVKAYVKRNKHQCVSNPGSKSNVLDQGIVRQLRRRIEQTSFVHVFFALQHICERFFFTFFKTMFSRFARDPTAVIVRSSCCAIARVLAPASANARNLSSSACVHGRAAKRPSSVISPSPSACRRDLRGILMAPW
jgi:hypothetical protein